MCDGDLVEAARRHLSWPHILLVLLTNAVEIEHLEV